MTIAMKSYRRRISWTFVLWYRLLALAFLMLFACCNARAQKVVVADALRFHKVDGAVPDVIIDESSSSSLSNGNWTQGNFSGGHLGTYQWTAQTDEPLSTLYWNVQVPMAGTYEVGVWYSPSTNRTSCARYRIEHAGGIASVCIDQTSGGNWQSLGIYDFEARNYAVQLSNRSSESIVEPVTVDNGDTFFSTTGTWISGTISSGYQDDYLYTGCSPTQTRSASWELPTLVPGNYRIEAWFNGGVNRTNKAEYAIQHNTGIATRMIDQTQGTAWHSLGTWPFQTGRTRISLGNTGPSEKVVIADAMRATYMGTGPIAPEIEMITDVPVLPAPMESFTVQARVWSANGITSVTATQLNENNEVTSAELRDDGIAPDDLAGDGIYQGNLPGAAAATVIRYYASAANTDAISTTPVYQCLTAWEEFDEPEMRWVFAGSQKTSATLDALVNRVREGNFNAICYTARSVADAAYESSFEPMMPGIPEGFDPLAYLIEQAHDTSEGKHYIQVHPLVLVYRALTSETPPPGHILQVHPEWISENYAGEQYVGQRLYTDQGIPEVQDHLVKVFNEILSNYAVDGLNLDFIRYRELDFGYNPIALNYFKEFTGRTDRPAADDPEWSEWRRLQVTSLVRRVAANMRKLRPDAVLSIDGICWNDPVPEIEQNLFYRHTYQDWPQWISAGYIDVVLGMAYRSEMISGGAASFDDWHVWLGNHDADRKAVAIVGGYQNTIQNSLVQMHRLRKSGSDWISLFSDNTTNNVGMSADEFYAATRSQIFPTSVPFPEMPWRENRGAVCMGIIRNEDGKPAQRYSVQVGNVTTQTDLCGFYALFNLPSGSHEIRVVDRTDVVCAAKTLNFNADAVTEHDFHLKPASADKQWTRIP